MPFTPVDPKQDFPKLEEEILALWEREKIFEKSVAKDAPKGNFIFFEGPPTANGRPGLHHVLARAFKDLIPRYKTMQGYRVERKAGWDTHGLPVELEVEKQLGISGKKEIENLVSGDPGKSIAFFNAKSRESVWRYKEEWERLTKRMGFWIDLQNSYITYEASYIETLWWIIRKIWDSKDKEGNPMFYRGHKVLPYCPRCGTALSSHEVAQGYRDVTEASVYVKFRLKAQSSKLKEEKSSSLEPSALSLEQSYLLAWTTTPWTLPGNVALAVGKDITYVEVRQGSEIYYLAKDRLSILEGTYEIVRELKGNELVGMTYEPLFDIAATQNAVSHQAHVADFVTTTDGTGIVHTAVMYGEEDYELGEKLGLPKHHTVDAEGKFTEEVNLSSGSLKGVFVKDAEQRIIEDLTVRGLLYKTEAHTHTYPFCWRCATPLLYYAKDSWFIRMSALREVMAEENNKIHWVPLHTGSGRFGNWLKEAKDWAFSRERYWGTPLPIWRCTARECRHEICIGSFNELTSRRLLPQGEYPVFLLRHGEADNNVHNILSGDLAHDTHHLTRLGEAHITEVAMSLKGRVDAVVTSPFMRTRETAEIIARVTHAELTVDERLHEVNFNVWNHHPIKEFEKRFPRRHEEEESPGDGVESLVAIRSRMRAAFDDIVKQYPEGRVLIVSHADPLLMLMDSLSGGKETHHLQTGELTIVSTTGNISIVTDPHRPFIDAVKLACEKCGGVMERVPEVADVWFDSGSMPFAQWHYPFEHRDKLEKEGFYPADYICEAVDQTRGWFYTLHAIGTLLGRGLAYRNVISLGHILDEKGQKMSKSKGNVIDPFMVMAKEGADILRFHFYAMNAPGLPKRFSLKELTERKRAFLLTLWNTYSFFVTYANTHRWQPPRTATPAPTHLLDHWIVARLNETIASVVKRLEGYHIFGATRAIEQLVTDLSTWYVRRSRDRFRDGDPTALATLYSVLVSLTKLLAPFMPFLAEALYQNLVRSQEGKLESIHLEAFPVVRESEIDYELLKRMELLRQYVERGHALRMRREVKVRQPLGKMNVLGAGLNHEEQTLLLEELNIKEFDVALTVDEEKNILASEELKVGEKVNVVIIDFTLTDELRREGMVRELSRQIQALRQHAKLSLHDQIELVVSTENQINKEVWNEVLPKVQATRLVIDLNVERVLVHDEAEGSWGTIKIGIRKV
ncbi:MAG: class I tRNA ligase family protein [Parcubacteria group bacterium]|nr:class I tRNA ligase family protein [Parcubacteria group bacterium]